MWQATSEFSKSEIMAERKIERVYRRLTDEERAEHARVREQIKKEFPPVTKRRKKRS